MNEMAAAIEKVEKLQKRREGQLIDLDRIREQSESLERELTEKAVFDFLIEQSEIIDAP